MIDTSQVILLYFLFYLLKVLIVDCIHYKSCNGTRITAQMEYTFYSLVVYVAFLWFVVIDPTGLSISDRTVLSIYTGKSLVASVIFITLEAILLSLEDPVSTLQVSFRKTFGVFKRLFVIVTTIAATGGAIYVIDHIATQGMK